MKVEPKRPFETVGQKSRLQTGAPGALQQSADLELPATDAANAAARDEFRLNTFPPDNHTPPASPAPPHPTPQAK